MKAYYKKHGRIFFVSMIAFILSICNSPHMVHAKRVPPPTVDPVTYNGIQYTASSNTIGHVIAIDEATGEQVDDITIYEIQYDPQLEKDVQDVFISKLEVLNHELIVYREDGKRYEIQLSEDRNTRDYIGPILLLFLGIAAAIALVIRKTAA